MYDIFILTEECPRKNSIFIILIQFIKDFLQPKIELSPNWIQGLYDTCYIEPKYCKAPNQNIISFLFEYEFVSGYLQGVNINKVHLVGVTGGSSFCDYMVYFTEIQPGCLFTFPPNQQDSPCMIIEETKTSDKESRNTGVYQRAIKFVYAKHYYPDSRLYMMYNNEHNPDHSEPTETNIFGTNLLLTLGVTILGKEQYMYNFHIFNSVEEIIEAKERMALPRYGQPTRITYDNSLYISCRLTKNNSMSHDPGIGTVAIIAGAVRSLGYSGRIIVTNHGITKEMIDASKGNKLLYVCNLCNVELENLILCQYQLPRFYWSYGSNSEKNASIYLHILAEKYGLRVLYHNHAGCERSYYLTKDYKYITIPKETEEGEKILIPDLIVFGKFNVTVIEGKKLDTLFEGLKEVDSYGIIEDKYIKSKNYGFPGIDIYRALTIYGGELKELPHERVLLYINNTGKIIVNPEAPYPWNLIFKEERLTN